MAPWLQWWQLQFIDGPCQILFFAFALRSGFAWTHLQTYSWCNHQFKIRYPKWGDVVLLSVPPMKRLLGTTYANNCLAHSLPCYPRFVTFTAAHRHEFWWKQWGIVLQGLLLLLLPFESDMLTCWSGHTGRFSLPSNFLFQTWGLMGMVWAVWGALETIQPVKHWTSSSNWFATIVLLVLLHTLIWDHEHSCEFDYLTTVHLVLHECAAACFSQPFRFHWLANYCGDLRNLTESWIARMLPLHSHPFLNVKCAVKRQSATSSQGQAFQCFLSGSKPEPQSKLAT